ncbi:tetratricopeptide repeat protein [bacterium]|nr:tetratricopeptide repeat protein [bacterium]
MDFPKSIKTYARLLSNYPSFLAIDQATYRLAACYEKIADFESAAKTYRELVSKYPYSSYYQIAQSRMKTLAPLTKDAKASIEVQENVVDTAKTEGQAAKASMDLAAMYYDSGDYKKAISEYKKVAAESPNAEIAREAFQKAASILDEKEKDYKGAAKTLEEMVTKYPNEPDTAKNLFKLGRIYEENLQEFSKRTRDGQVLLKKSNENIEKAIDYYNKITETSSDADISADAFLRKGELYETRLKDKESAKKQYEDFLKHFPDHQDAEKIRERLQKLEEE